MIIYKEIDGGELAELVDLEQVRTLQKHAKPNRMVPYLARFITINPIL